MMILAWTLVLSPIAAALYTYGAYPLILRFLPARTRSAPQFRPDFRPRVSISLPVYNEQAQIRSVLESLIALEYPRELVQIVVISDASDDGTDDIVREYASRGVELVRQTVRRGKTAAENAGARYLTGDIVVNTDASIRIAPGALSRIVAPFTDPSVGLVSGRDVSVARQEHINAAESGYVGYEMRVRSLETRTGGIIGASGCFYAIRPQLHRMPLPEALSRDFASALITHECGMRPISADDAICLVPRTASPQREYRRKVRTVMRGMETLAYKRHLLHPRHGLFSWKLLSHKVCRWLVPWTAVLGLLGLAIMAVTQPRLWIALAIVGTACGAVAALTWRVTERSRLPAIVATAGSVILANIAVLHATIGALRGNENPIWEPTRREPVTSSDTA